MTKQITGTYFVWNYSMTVSHVTVTVHIFVLWLGFPFDKRSLFSSWNPRATCNMDCTIPVLSRGITIAWTFPFSPGDFICFTAETWPQREKSTQVFKTWVWLNDFWRDFKLSIQGLLTGIFMEWHNLSWDFWGY